LLKQSDIERLQNGSPENPSEDESCFREICAPHTQAFVALILKLFATTHKTGQATLRLTLKA
jgi:hypothetical protein